MRAFPRDRTCRQVLAPERRAFLGSGATPIVKVGGGDAGVPGPLLDTVDVGVVLEGGDRRGGVARMHAEITHARVEPDGCAGVPHDVLVERPRIERAAICPVSVSIERLEE
ncbi:MAG: hypothetical protein OXH60_02695 [Rhodospirillales bacterium]|nr:hypothetical protein [Rhodospirillales bacterium]